MNKFNYQDEVYYLDVFGNIKKGIFSEYWDYECSYLAGGKLVETNRLFDTEKNLLLNMFKEKENSIKSSQRLIEELQRRIPELKEELIKIQNKINKVRNENDTTKNSY